MGACALQGNKPMVEKIIVRALKSLSDNQVVINRDVWLKVGVPALSCLPCHYYASDKSCRAPCSHTCYVISAPAQDVVGPYALMTPMLKPQVWPTWWALGHCCDSCSWPISFLHQSFGAVRPSCAKGKGRHLRQGPSPSVMRQGAGWYPGKTLSGGQRPGSDIYQACAVRAHAHDYAGPKILSQWLGVHAAV